MVSVSGCDPGDSGSIPGFDFLVFMYMTSFRYNTVVVYQVFTLATRVQSPLTDRYYSSMVEHSLEARGTKVQFLLVA
jgi:hypothetical protein